MRATVNRGRSSSGWHDKDGYREVNDKQHELIFCCWHTIFVKCQCAFKSANAGQWIHPRMNGLPVCKCKRVLGRPGKSIGIGSRVTNFICAVDVLHRRSHRSQRWRELTSWRLLHGKKSQQNVSECWNTSLIGLCHFTLKVTKLHCSCWWTPGAFNITRLTVVCLEKNGYHQASHLGFFFC